MKKESNLKRLLDYAGGYKYLTIASWILSAISALVALLPFVYIWKVIRGDSGRVPRIMETRRILLITAGWRCCLR